ncbi:MAG: bifunctional folylpolyglutamate synthase/dihydrofolate synthase, partial [Cyclobacteriaceae bacterium]
EEKNAPILFASDDTKPLYASDLKGNYQEKNQFTARTAIDVLNKTSSFTVSEEQVQNGLLHVTKNTGLKGRWQQLNDSPLTICDTAHNQQGLTAVIDQLLAIPHEQLHFILGFVDDKEVDIILELFPKEATYTFCEPPIKRAMEADAVLAVAKKKGLNGTVIMDVNKALKQVVEKVHPNDVVYVGGSTFVVAEIENL